MLYPIDDAIQQYRIKALTTPPEAFEMTGLDQEMSKILSRTDLPKEQKMKRYFQALSKFQTARSMFVEEKQNTPFTPAVTPPPVVAADVMHPQQQQQVEESANTGEHNDEDDTFVDANEGTMVASTPVKTSSSPRKSKLLTPEKAMRILQSDTGLRLDSDKVYFGDKQLGKIDQLDAILKFLLSESGNAKSPKFTDVGIGQYLNQPVRNQVMTKQITALLKDYVPEQQLAPFPKLRTSAVKKQMGSGGVRLTHTKPRAAGGGGGRGRSMHAKRASNHRAVGGGGGGGIEIDFDRWQSIM